MENSGTLDRLWTPWRYSYITGAKPGRKGVADELSGWPGPPEGSGADPGCVFCNLIGSVDWGVEAIGREAAERAGLLVARGRHCFVCLNRFPYSSGHVMVVPYRHLDSLAALPVAEAEEMMRLAQRIETALRAVYRPDGINLGMNLGEAAGAGVAEHLHLHVLPRWIGDTNFMTVVGATRVLPETLDVTWERVRAALGESATSAGTATSK